MILTLDLGTSATKAMVWADDGPAGAGRAEIGTTYPRPGWAEQEPEDWWAAAVAACRQLDSRVRSEVEIVVFASARETLVPVDRAGRPLGAALLWSDRRAGKEAASLAASLGGVDAFRARSGVTLDAGAPLAKLAWLAGHQPERVSAARWVLSPRDLLGFRLTGEVGTDTTLAGRAGFIDLDGRPVDAADADRLLPPVLAPTAVVGSLGGPPAAELGLPSGVPVVIGAGDRACEALGTGAGERAGRAVLSWGTTANVGVPCRHRPAMVPPGATLSPAAPQGWLAEWGLSAAGAALDWLHRLTGRGAAELGLAMVSVEPGAEGVVAVPWLNGARAPWWRPGAQAAFFHLTPAHGPAELARALFEGVAFEAQRCLEGAGGVSELVAAGGGSLSAEWLGLVAAVTGCPVMRRAASADAASAGACLLAAPRLTVDDISPVVATVTSDAGLIARYRSLRRRSDLACRAVLKLAEEGEP